MRFAPSLATLLGGVSALAMAAPAAAQDHRLHADHVLGTSFDMAVATASPAEAQMAFAAAQDEITRLERVLSGWRPGTELAALNAADTHLASPDLFAVIAACEAWRERTGGAFDARIGGIEAAWRAADTAPNVSALCAAASQSVSLHPASRAIARPAGLTFAPDGLAKGYILDAALAAASRAAPCAQGLLIDIGGDVRCRGVDASGQAWRVGVADPANLADNAAPAEVVRLENQALAVSGPGARDRMVGGEAMSHLLVPATGAPAPRVQAAVVGPRAADADALATALAVMPKDEALALAERLDGFEALLMAADGSRAQTSGWSAIASAQCAAPIPAGFQVSIEYELPRIDVANYKRPYVIVWVTDAAKTPIKTLLITGDRPQWQEDNYVWWRRIGRRTPDVVAATARPTRAPGKYTVTWDGTDAAGRRMPQGQYILHIEAAREHGGHAYQTVEVNLGAAGITATAPAKDELGVARIRYGR